MAKSFYRQIAAILSEHGFILYRQGKGSHEGWRHPDGRTTTVSRNLYSRHTANGILKQADIKTRIR